MIKKIVSNKNRFYLVLQIISVLLIVISGLAFNFTQGFVNEAGWNLHSSTVIAGKNISIASGYIFMLPSILLLIFRKNENISLHDFFIHVMSLAAQFFFLFTCMNFDVFLSTIRSFNVPLLLWVIASIIFITVNVIRLLESIKQTENKKTFFIESASRFRFTHMGLLAAIIISAWMFNFTKGLMTDSMTYCIDWPSSTADDNIIIFLSNMFFVPLLLAAFNSKKYMGNIEFLINIAFYVLQILMILFGAGCGSIFLTLKYSFNIPLFLWILSFALSFLAALILWITKIFCSPMPIGAGFDLNANA